MGDAEKIIRAKLSNFPDHGARDGAAVYKITGAELGTILDELTRTQVQPTGDGKPDRETAIAALRSALTEEWHDTVNARRWTEDVLLTGCRNVGGGKGYERAEDAAANLAGMAVDAILARQGPGPGEAVARAAQAVCDALTQDANGRWVLDAEDPELLATSLLNALAATTTREVGKGDVMLDLDWVLERAQAWSADKDEDSVKALAWNFNGMFKEWQDRLALQGAEHDQ